MGKPEPLPVSPDFRHAKVEPHERNRLFANFNKLAISKESWLKDRNKIWKNTSTESLKNPTDVMINIMSKLIKDTHDNNRNPPENGRLEITSIMEEVIKHRKVNNKTAKKTPMTSNLPEPSKTPPIPLSKPDSPPKAEGENSSDDEIVFKIPSPKPRKIKKLNVDMKRKRKAGNQESRELKRLRPFLEDPPRSIRRKANASPNLQGAFQTGLGNVRRLMRRVSETIFSYY